MDCSSQKSNVTIGLRNLLILRPGPAAPHQDLDNPGRGIKSTSSRSRYQFGPNSANPIEPTCRASIQYRAICGAKLLAPRAQPELQIGRASCRERAMAT